jgi:hypothetical protein
MGRMNEVETAINFWKYRKSKEKETWNGRTLYAHTYMI